MPELFAMTDNNNNEFICLIGELIGNFLIIY